MRNQKFIIMPHFRLHEWIAEEKGYFADEGLDYEFQETVQSTDGKAHAQGDKVGAMQIVREGPHLGHQLRLPLDRQCRGREGPRQALRRRLFGVAVRRLRAAGFEDQIAGGSRRRADLGRLPVGQPLRDHPGARAVHAARPDQPLVQRRHAVQPHGPAVRGQDPGLHAVLGAVLLRRAARLPQGDRLHLHDGHDDHRRARSGGRAQVLPRAEARAARHRPAAGALHALSTRTNFPSAITP